MMMMLMKLILNILLRPHKDSDLALENLALRQQLAILKRPKKRLQIRTKDRLFWMSLARIPSVLNLLTISHKPAKSAFMMKMLLKLILNILLRLHKDFDLALETVALRRQ